MAVEINKRKRKHKSEPDEGDEGEAAVPKKVAKKMKTPKKKQPKSAFEEGQVDELGQSAEQPEMDEEEEGHDAAQRVEDVNQDSGFEETKFSKDFKMLNFRTKLRGTNFITELRHFLYLAKTSAKIVAKYIEKRGKPLELAESLERIDKSNVLHAALVCEALQLVVMEVVSQQQQLMESAVYACRYFLKSHGGVVDLLLKSPQLQHRRVGLKLLTAIVCVDAQLGRQLLSNYDVLSNVKTIESLLSHSQLELQQEETVRKCFIHFVLAYLVDGNALLIRNILDRGTLIRALASGLLYDDHVTVCAVLNTLRQYVLQCPHISKTKKIHVFDLECCKNVARLYEWWGPRVFAFKCTDKKAATAAGADKRLAHDKFNKMVNAEEREAVAAAAHDFLLELLTSRKYGITFDTVTQFRQKHNVIQGKLIGFLYKPWDDARKTELVLKILQACPDLARHTVRNFAGIVNPFRTPQKHWVQAVAFLARIIETLHPKLLRAALEQITLTDYSYWVKDICLPVETLALLNGSKMLRHVNYEFRLATNCLLYAMFAQYSNFMCVVRKRELTRSGDSTLRRFKFDILNHLMVNYPNVEHILYSLYMTTQGQEGDEAVLKHLEVTLDLILIICKEHRPMVDKTNTILEYLTLLRPLYAGEESTEAAHAHIHLELKAVKVILLLFPKALDPRQKLFGSVLNSFIKAFVHGAAAVQLEAGQLLHGIFKNTGLFDGGELEIDLWLEPLRYSDNETVNVVAQVFVEVLQVTKADVELPKNTETATNKQQLHKLFENIEKGLSVQAHIEALSVSKLLPLICKGVEIVPPLDKYLEVVCLLLYHYYPNPEYVLQLYSMHFTRLQPYMTSWLPSAQHKEALQAPPKDITKTIPQLQQLQQAVLQEKIKFEDIFVASGGEGTGTPLEVEFNGKKHQLQPAMRNPKLLMLYMQQVLFLVARLVELRSLQQAQAERAAAYVNFCLKVMQQLEEGAEPEQEQALQEGNAEQSTSLLDQALKYIFSVRLTYIRSEELFSASDATHVHYLHFLCALTEQCNSFEHFGTHANNYRLKLVKAVAISLQSLEQVKAQSEQLTICIKLVDAFQLSAANCGEVLDLLSRSPLKYNDFFNSSQQPTFYYQLLVCILGRLNALQSTVECDAFLRKFMKFYSNFVHKLGADVNLEQLEEVFYNFLLVSHQLIQKLDVKFFECIFVERKLNKFSIKLAALLLRRVPKFDECFLKVLPTHLQQKELIYPLLEVAFHKQLPLEESLLTRIYQEYKSGFMRSVEKPQKAAVIYRAHVDCSAALVERCMPGSECVDFCNKHFKFDSIETYQMRLIHAIYTKALNTVEAEGKMPKKAVFVNFIQLQVQMLSVELKKQTQIDLDKLELWAYLVYDWFKVQAPKNMLQTSALKEDGVADAAIVDFKGVLQSQNWFNFCKACLRVGMHLPEADTEVAAMSKTQALLLQLLAYLSQQMYADFEATESENCMEEPAQLYDMVFTHSKFYDIVLGTQCVELKGAVLHLLFALARKCPNALQHTQVPTILGAYQAKLTAADRYALALLQLYEQHLGVAEVQQYRPFIWGESAVAFYALRGEAEERTKLSQQETSIAQVMSLIDKQVCEYTIDNFPIWRRLQTKEQLPTVEYVDPKLKALTFGTNDLERKIELALATASYDKCHLDAATLRLCPKKDGTFEQCYDPAFFVPLMSMCFAPESFTHAARPVQNGLLALSFAALSSQDKDMRLAAANVQLRYRAHFEQSKFFERPLWIQAYENIQAGLSDLRESWLQHNKRNSGTPRVPYIPCLFIAKTLNLTTEPTHLLYKQLTMYLRLKSSFNFLCVPEFNVLFFSPEVEHHAFRQFIVEIMRNGIKCSADLFLLLSTNTFKVLMGFYGSTMSTLELNLHILGVFSNCVKIPAGTKIMLEQLGMLSWLSDIVSSLEFYQFDIIEGLISILSNLWYALRANSHEFHNYAHLCSEIHRLVLLLLPHLSARISSAYFARLLNVLNKTAVAPHQLAVDETQLQHLIDCAEKHYSKALVRHIENVKVFGGAGAASDAQYCQQLWEQHADISSILALSSLRAYTIGWWQCRHGTVPVPVAETPAK